MSVTAHVSDDGSEVTIAVDGRFDFNAHQDFRQAYELCDGPRVRYTVDMARAEHLDSSALGMLLMLREHAGGGESEVVLRNCREDIRNILTIANFQKLFSIQ